MKTSLSMTTRSEIPSVAPAMGCPLQQAMEQIAQVAVRQHVLYQEGESQPRPELLARLEAWSSLHRLIRLRICTASRESRITFVDLESALDELFPQPSDVAAQRRVQHFRAALVACARATSCPLGAKVAE
ncbi:MAG TPA: hypothetical protein VFX24_09545 [Ktedonobacterales bacterium]|nr:hypothetical protein [Ktedonobacterales bacterium]